MTDSLQTREIDVESLNAHIDRDPELLVRISEKNYIDRLRALAEQLTSRRERVRAVMVGGPSASSKTTTAHKLRDELSAGGRQARIVSIDDFFQGLDSLPRLPDGAYDMDSIAGVDVALARECLCKLLETGSAVFPIFDFVTQSRSERTHRIELSEDGILIIEGTHALNPVFTEGLPEDSVFRVYAGVMTGYALEGREIFSPRDIRLARRMVRDQLFRSWSAEKTLMQWGSVCAGEELFIDPYKGSADAAIDSALDYEPAVLHNFLFPMLETIPETSPYAGYAADFKRRCAHFRAISPEMIPPDSLLREFTGD